MARLAADSYGKSDVRLTKVTRRGQLHTLLEMSVAIELQGDFARCYTHGDNSHVIPTDTQKNTVYVLAKKHDFNSPEEFGSILARHFLDNFDHVSQTKVTIQQTLWQRIDAKGRPHDHAFTGGQREMRGCEVTARRDAEPLIFGKIDGLHVLKTTRSGFSDFIKDEYTTLNETADRIFATIVLARWHYTKTATDWNACYDQIRDALLDVFAEHFSLAVQQTLFAMGEAALDACADIDEIHLEMPNQHRLLVSLEPFGLENANEIFAPTSAPYGLITGVMRRD